MKKLALLAATITLMGISANCFAAAEATVLLNNFDSNNAILFATGGGAGAAATAANGVSVQLLGGPSATQLQPVIPTGGGNGVIPVAGAAAGGLAGFFDGGVGVVPGVAANGTATLQLVAFTGTDPSGASAVKSAPWTQPTGSWDRTAQPPAPPGGPALQNPAGLTVGGVIPEPSTIALGLLGLGALLIRRRS